MSKSLKIETIDELLEKASVYIPEEENIKLIKEAYDFADLKHKGQFRKSGEGYIIHPLNVALILTTIYSDTQTIMAGLLHDVLEDCDCTREEMEEKFGREVTNLVYGVTKLGRINFSTENEYLIEYYKKRKYPYRKLLIKNYVAIYRVDYKNKLVYISRVVYGVRNYLNEI